MPGGILRHSASVWKGLFGRPIPFKSDALFWLDGTIVSDEFVDKSGNGKNFTITNNDITINGFPYKSAATISAPIGDATLIAADINSFLYTAGTPNEIPVVSFFQDIDYEHKLFCKHKAQILDASSVETYEPRVLDIVLYNTVKTGSDLTACQSYYGVPIEELTTVKWVTKGGNDTTGDGSKLLPWLTIQHAASNMTANDTVYVKTGTYTELLDASFNLLLNTNGTFTNLGFTNILSGGAGGTVVTTFNFTGSFNNFIVNGTGKAKSINASGSGSTSINRCKTYGSTAAISLSDANNSVTNCVVIQTNGGANLIEDSNSCNLSTNLFIITNCLFGIYISGTSKTVNILNNDIRLTASSAVPFTNVGTGTLNIKGNSVINEETGTLFDFTSVSAYTLDFSYNTIISTANHTADVILFNASGVNDITMTGNSLSFSGVVTSGVSAIALLNQVAPVVSNNIITSTTTNNFTFIENTSASSTIGNTTISNNRLITKSLGGYIIMIGTESTGVNDNKITPIISNNFIDGALTADPSASGIIHGVFVGHNINPTIILNYITGVAYSVVVKHSGDTYTAKGVYYNVISEARIGIHIKGVDGLVTYGNTVVNSTVKGTPIYTINNALVNNSNIVIKNNIIEDLHAVGEYCIRIASGDTSGLDTDYNILYSTNVANFLNLEGTPVDFAGWQTAGYGANSINISADLVNFIPQVGSSALGNGETLAAAYDDGLDSSTNWGNTTTVPSVVTKQQTAPWDIGAYVS